MDLVSLINAADLECYMGRNPKNHQPYLYDVCHRYRFSQPPQCLKFTQGEVVTRGLFCLKITIKKKNQNQGGYLL
jgi:uncharacterized protein YcgL (UPF0745 family)